jgi:hypothetical protein
MTDAITTEIPRDIFTGEDMTIDTTSTGHMSEEVIIAIVSTTTGDTVITGITRETIADKLKAL